MRFFLIIYLLFVGVIGSSFAASPTTEQKVQARRLAKDALTYISVKNYTKARSLLYSAHSLDTSSYIYSYEIGYTHVLEKDYTHAVPFYRIACTKADATDYCYMMLGSCYFLMGRQEEAMEVLQNGLKRFPNSGRLYQTMGDVNQDNLVKALHYYEKGVIADPTYTTNYYWLSKIFCNSTEQMWGVIYGEIFLNMEENSARAKEIGKLLFTTYQESIRFSGDTLVTISFCKNSLTYPNEHKTEWLPLTMIYEPCMQAAVRLGDTITLASLHTIRSRFIDAYFAENYNISHPCVLFDWHKDLIQQGYFECYNYWLMQYGSEVEFEQWLSRNRDKYESFLKWKKKHPLYIEKGRQFHRYGK